MSDPNLRFMRDISVCIDRKLRTSGLLARLSPQDLQTLICLLTYADTSARCVLSARDVARALDLSEKQATERLRRLSHLSFHGNPVVIDEGDRRTGSGRFAKGRFRILPLPGMEIRTGKRSLGKWDGDRPSCQEAHFLLSPGEVARFPTSRDWLRKQASGTPADAAGSKGVASNYNKTTQHSAEDREELLKLLRCRGVSELTAQDLIRSYPAGRIQRQAEMLPHREARDPAAMLVKAIREDWDAPAAYTAMLLEKAAKSERERAESEAEAKRKARERSVEKALSKLSPQELRDITARAREKVKATLKGAMGERIPRSLVDAQVKKIISEEYLDKPNRSDG